MKAILRIVSCIALLGGGLTMGAQMAVAQTPADAQTPTILGPPEFDSDLKFNSGLDVVPTFDGWMQNDDGTFTLVFGYFNRNYREELVIPPGPNNNLSLGGVDQGQPTIFAPRRQTWIFLLKVPKDFGDKEVVWTLTSHGRTEKATGKLIRQLYITPRLIMSHGNLSPTGDICRCALEEGSAANQRPSIEIGPQDEALVGKPLQLNALVSDDGLPKPRVPKTVAGAQIDRQGPSARVTVRWLPYRGPEGVTFDDSGPTPAKGCSPGTPCAKGQVTAVAHFSAPGAYTLIATADDSELTTPTTFTVNVAKQQVSSNNP